MAPITGGRVVDMKPTFPGPFVVRLLMRRGFDTTEIANEFRLPEATIRNVLAHSDDRDRHDC